MRRSTLAHLIRTALAAGIVAPSLTLAADPHVLEFSARPLDTRVGVTNAPRGLQAVDAAAPGLRLVQFDGPVQQAWLDHLAAQGARPLRYIRNNGYLVWAGDTRDVSRLATLRGQASWLTYEAPLHAALKLDPTLDTLVQTPGIDTQTEIDIVVQFYAHAADDGTRSLIDSVAVLPLAQRGPLGAGRLTSAGVPVLGFRHIDLRVRIADLAAIARRPDVSFVGQRMPTRLYDEKQSLIMAGDLLPGAASASHLDFLRARGFSEDPATYPVVDITDSSVQEGGTGVGVTDTQDPTLRLQGELTQASRVMYFENCSDQPDTNIGAEDGHGTINASILAGYDQREGFPYQDDDGQRLGLGVNPFARIGSTAIFIGTGPGFNVFGCGGDDQGIIAANARNGAAISSNSWGSSGTGTYTVRDALYDIAVRDVDAGEESRPMTYLIAAGNDGPSIGTVGTPGSAKNVITVGASENLRPVAIQSQCPDDSLPIVADDPMSIADFSGRGPVAGNRTKPEVVAPGTHITGSRSIFPGFGGGGVCIPNFPAGQAVFSASSGTSHSTPAVSGVASLAYWWIENGGGSYANGTLDLIGGARAPSPALMKAWMMAHPIYFTGESAGDTLPSQHQGYGMPDMNAMFDATPKAMLDQSDLIDSSGDTREYLWGVDDASAPVRIALTWTDAPGQPGTSPQVNDLDLRVEIDGVTYHGNHFDGGWSTPGGDGDDRNNYEAVFLPPGSGGDIRIVVEARNIAGDGVPSVGDATDQDFALVCVNCRRVPTFTAALRQPALQACVGGGWHTRVQLDPLIGFDEPVTLSLDGLPSGVSAQFSPNPAAPPARPGLQIDASPDATVGTWPVTLRADAATAAREVNATLSLYDTLPAPPTGLVPAASEGDVPALASLAWEASADAHTYLVQVARDAQFADIVLSHETRDTAWSVPANAALQTSARYWWRVIALNACGDSTGKLAPTGLFADAFEAVPLIPGQPFTTEVLPGDCPVDATTTVLFADDLDAGAPGWTVGARSGNNPLWALSEGTDGDTAWRAAPPASGATNDAWLVSPDVTLPPNLTDLTLAFRDRQSLKAGAAGTCYDAAVVEVSEDGGNSWSKLDTPLTPAFDGNVSAAFGNPLAGQQAWCGDPGADRATVLDLADHAGKTVRFRFRLGHDRFPHRQDTNWVVDDVRVAGCGP